MAVCVEIPLSSLRVDGGTQPRAVVDHDTIQEYTQHMQDGIQFPPVIVFYDGSHHWLADGFHRYYAAQQAGLSTTIDAEIRQGTRRDAILYSVGANASHGLRRSNEDKRRAVETLLRDEEWARWSNREIARRCAVDEWTVRKYRDGLSAGNPQIARKVERNGTIYAMNISNGGLAHAPIDHPTSPAITEQEESGQIPQTLPAIRDAKRLAQPAIEAKETEKQSLQRSANALDAIFPGFARWVQEREATLSPVPIDQPPSPIITKPPAPPSHETLSPIFPGFARWQQDNVDLGLDPFGDPLPPQEKPPVKSVTLTALQSSESNEWYTPAQYIAAARELMGTISLDPASNAFANQVVQACSYYDEETDGLAQPWTGTVWLNPPYGQESGRSNQEVWSHRLIDHYQQGDVSEAVLLVNANTEAQWFQPLYAYPICFTHHRIRFYNATGTPNQPTQGNAFIYFGSQVERFREIFSRFGTVLRRMEP